MSHSHCHWHHLSPVALLTSPDITCRSADVTWRHLSLCLLDLLLHGFAAVCLPAACCSGFFWLPVSALIARTLAGQLYFHIHPLLLLFFMMELFSRWHFSVEQTSSILLLLSHSSSFLLLLFFFVLRTLSSHWAILLSHSLSFLLPLLFFACWWLYFLIHSLFSSFFLFSGTSGLIRFGLTCKLRFLPHLQAPISGRYPCRRFCLTCKLRFLPHLQAPVLWVGALFTPRSSLFFYFFASVGC